jgi:hypothetical protein
MTTLQFILEGVTLTTSERDIYNRKNKNTDKKNVKAANKVQTPNKKISVKQKTVVSHKKAIIEYTLLFLNNDLLLPQKVVKYIVHIQVH